MTWAGVLQGQTGRQGAKILRDQSQGGTEKRGGKRQGAKIDCFVWEVLLTISSGQFAAEANLQTVM